MNAQRKPPLVLFVLIFSAVGHFCAPVRAAPENAVAEPPVAETAAEARLIDGGGADGARYAGLRIRLPGDALTYWRDPGEAGVAPTFDFSASENLASAEPLFPQPERLAEGGAQANGYRGEVVFPLRLRAKAPERPIVLALAVDYAICDRLCLPRHAALRLNLPPGGALSPELAHWLAQVPRPLNAAEAAAFATLSALPDQDGHKRRSLRLAAPARDLLADSPSGFFIETRREGEAFQLVVVDHPAGEDWPSAPLRLTATGDKPVEFSVKLP